MRRTGHLTDQSPQKSTWWQALPALPVPHHQVLEAPTVFAIMLAAVARSTLLSLSITHADSALFITR